MAESDKARHAMLQGKDKVLLFRNLKNTELEAAKLVFQTDHTFTYSRDLDKIITKDGTVIRRGELETEVAGIEAIQSKNDPTVALLQDAVIKGEKLEIWELTVDEDLKDEEGKYPAVYAQGYLGSWELPANVEEEATISSDFQVELEPQFGYGTLTEEQEDAVQYMFRDTIAIDPEEA